MFPDISEQGLDIKQSAQFESNLLKKVTLEWKTVILPVNR